MFAVVRPHRGPCRRPARPAARLDARRGADDRGRCRSRTGTGAAVAPPLDTGEAVGLPPARLTITFGLGPSALRRRFGLASRRPAALRRLGPLPGDELDPARSGGDLCVQACSDDPQVAFHAVRNLARIGRGAASCAGRSSASAARPRRRQRAGDAAQPPGLQGRHEQPARATTRPRCERFVWVGDDEPQRWMRGGTYLVARRIRMLIEAWDRTSLAEQEHVIGRFKDERRAAHRQARARRGRSRRAGEARPSIPPTRTSGWRAGDERRRCDPAPRLLLHRRHRPGTGQLDAGLFFIAFQRDPHRQFVAIQRRLGETTRSTSTSSTRAARSSPSRRARSRAASSAKACSKPPSCMQRRRPPCGRPPSTTASAYG